MISLDIPMKGGVAVDEWKINSLIRPIVSVLCFIVYKDSVSEYSCQKCTLSLYIVY